MPNFSEEIVKIGKSMGICAETIDLQSYLQQNERKFKFCYLDSCGSLSSLKQSLCMFVGKNMVIEDRCIVSFVVEMKRTMGANACHFIRNFIFNELCRYIPYCFQEPILLKNEADISNKMQVVVCEIKKADHAHNSVLSEWQQQEIFCGKRRGVARRVKQDIYIQWDEEPKTDKTDRLRFDYFPEEFTTIGVCDPQEISVKDPLLKTKISKKFDGAYYHGTVDNVRQVGKRTWYHVLYEDNDEEEMSASEVKRFKRD
jgi:hypothetical protein